MTKFTKSRIGASGVLLLQSRLLREEIESAPMTTDYGIDLVAISPRSDKTFLIQVKTTMKEKPAGGKVGAKKELSFPPHKRNSCAQYLALVYPPENKIWILTKEELESVDCQKNGKNYHVVIWREPRPNSNNNRSEEYFERYSFDNAINKYFLK